MGGRHSVESTESVLRGKRLNAEAKFTSATAMHEERMKELSRNREENQAWANNLGENHSTVLQRLAEIERAQLEEQSKYKQIELARLQKRVDKLKEELLEREAKEIALKATVAKRQGELQQSEQLMEVAKKNFDELMERKAKELASLKEQHTAVHGELSAQQLSALGITGMTRVAQEAMQDLQRQVHNLPSGISSLKMRLQGVLQMLDLIINGSFKSLLNYMEKDFRVKNFTAMVSAKDWKELSKEDRVEVMDIYLSGIDPDFREALETRNWCPSALRAKLLQHRSELTKLAKGLKVAEIDEFDVDEIIENFEREEQSGRAIIDQVALNAGDIADKLGAFVNWRTAMKEATASISVLPVLEITEV